MAETFVPAEGGLATAPGRARAPRRGLRLPAQEIEQLAAAGAVTDEPPETSPGA